MDLAVNVIQFCETVKGHYSLVNQLERSATSIGANIREANYAHGKADFIAKLQKRKFNYARRNKGYMQFLRNGTTTFNSLYQYSKRK